MASHILTVRKIPEENRDFPLRHKDTYEDIRGGQDDDFSEGDVASWEIDLDSDEEERLQAGEASNVIAVEENVIDYAMEEIPQRREQLYIHSIAPLREALRDPASRRRLNNVKIAIIDTGVGGDFQLMDRVLKGYSAVTDERWYESTHDHGTHVAGIATPPRAKLLIAKGLSNSGSGYRSNIIRCIHWCVDQGAHVINMSLGGPGDYSESYEQACKRAKDRGVNVWAASGNNGREEKSLPAALPSAIAIGSADADTGRRSRFSNYGDHLFALASGDEVLSYTFNGNLATKSGTSMATPNAAYGDAILIALHGKYSKRIEAFQKYGHHFSNNMEAKEQGIGRLCVYRADEYLAGKINNF